MFGVVCPDVLLFAVVEAFEFAFLPFLLLDSFFDFLLPIAGDDLLPNAGELFDVAGDGF